MYTIGVGKKAARTGDPYQADPAITPFVYDSTKPYLLELMALDPVVGSLVYNYVDRFGTALSKASPELIGSSTHERDTQKLSTVFSEVLKEAVGGGVQLLR